MEKKTKKTNKPLAIISTIVAVIMGIYFLIDGINKLGYGLTLVGLFMSLCGIALIVIAIIRMNKINKAEETPKSSSYTKISSDQDCPVSTTTTHSSSIAHVSSHPTSISNTGNNKITETYQFCAQCGAKLSQGANFCHSCGAPVPVQEPTPNVTETPKDWESYFRNILQKNFPQFTVKENVPVTELTGDINDVFRLYKERPNQVYKAEWGKPYNFVLYSEGKAKAVIMLATTNEHSVKVTYLISKMFAKKLNVPYLGFYTKFNNKEEYVVNRIKSNLC